jgi:hypothetical protein
VLSVFGPVGLKHSTYVLETETETETERVGRSDAQCITRVDCHIHLKVS